MMIGICFCGVAIGSSQTASVTLRQTLSKTLVQSSKDDGLASDRDFEAKSIR